MKICSIRIKNYKQFKDVYLDFTNPETGEPVEKICFIGRNGTGKSTLLVILYEFLNTLQFWPNSGEIIGHFKITMKLKFQDQEVYLFRVLKGPNNGFIFKAQIDEIPNWQELLSTGVTLGEIHNQAQFSNLRKYLIEGDDLTKFIYDFHFKNNSKDLLIYSPSEDNTNSYLQVRDVPVASLNEALGLLNIFPYLHLVSFNGVSNFWRTIVYLIKKRDNEQQEFETKPENINKTKKVLIEEFDRQNPLILSKLAELWNKILGKAGLEFDVANAQKPIQLNDNLRAYIHLKGSKERINYNQLSTGIRNFIFRVGHIYSLYFNREIKNGFLLIDEPENSLFPDFLFDLIETYQQLVIDKNGENNTQIFVSTHNPIIAAQFQPYERIILEWDEDGYVTAHKGSAPIGDDPNDVLTKDFELTHLMGKEGEKMWDEYMNLRKQLRRTEDESEKEKLMSKINEIGTKYNF